METATSNHPTLLGQAVVKSTPVEHCHGQLVPISGICSIPLLHSSFLTLLHFHLPYLDISFHIFPFHRLVEVLCDKGVALRKGAACGSAGASSHLILYIEIGSCT